MTYLDDYLNLKRRIAQLEIDYRRLNTLSLKRLPSFVSEVSAAQLVASGSGSFARANFTQHLVLRAGFLVSVGLFFVTSTEHITAGAVVVTPYINGVAKATITMNSGTTLVVEAPRLTTNYFTAGQLIRLDWAANAAFATNGSATTRQMLAVLGYVYTMED